MSNNIMAINQLPPIEELSIDYIHDDLFICALGFEDRCIAAPQILKKLNYNCKNVIMLQYDAHQTANNKNRKKLEKTLASLSGEIPIRSEYFFTNPLESENKFIKAYRKSSEQSSISSVTVDISSFSCVAIIQILDLLFQQKLKQIRIVYTEAKTYFPLKKDAKKRMPDDIYLSSGVKDTIILPKFSGVFLPGYSTLLVIFLGFDPIRARGAINFFQPSKKIGIIGVPYRDDRKWRADEVEKRNLKMFDDVDERIRLSTFNYNETLLKLNELYGEFSPTSNMAICPLGSKLQTLGVFLFAIGHPDVKLLFPIPIEFHPERYSKDYTKTWQIVFDNFMEDKK